MYSCALPPGLQQGAATESVPALQLILLYATPPSKPHLLSEGINGLLAQLQLLVASVNRHSKLGIALHSQYSTSRPCQRDPACMMKSTPGAGRTAMTDLGTRRGQCSCTSQQTGIPQS